MSDISQLREDRLISVRSPHCKRDLSHNMKTRRRKKRAKPRVRRKKIRSDRYGNLPTQEGRAVLTANHQFPGTFQPQIQEVLLHSSNPKMATDLPREIGLQVAATVNVDLTLMDSKRPLQRIHQPLPWELGSHPVKDGLISKPTIAVHNNKVQPKKPSSSKVIGSGLRQNCFHAPSTSPNLTCQSELSENTRFRIQQFLSQIHEPQESIVIAKAANCYSAYSALRENGIVQIVKGKEPSWCTLQVLDDVNTSSVSHGSHSLLKTGQRSLTSSGGLSSLNPEDFDNSVLQVIESVPQKALSLQEIVAVMTSRQLGDCEKIEQSLKKLSNRGVVTIVTDCDPPLWRVNTSMADIPCEPSNLPMITVPQMKDPIINTCSSETLSKDVNDHTVSSSTVTPRSQMDENACFRIQQFLSQSSEPCKSLAISTATGLAHHYAYWVLLQMEKNGIVQFIKGKGPPLWTLVQKDVNTSSVSHGSHSLLESQRSLTSSGGLSSLNPEDFDNSVLQVIESVPQKALSLQQIVTVMTSRQLGDHDYIQLSLQRLSNRGAVTMVTNCDPPLWRVTTSIADVLHEPSKSTVLPHTKGPIIKTCSSATLVKDLSRNPVDVLSSYCHSQGLKLKFSIVHKHGSLFVAAASFGSYCVKAESIGKKSARRIAAELALQKLRAIQFMRSQPSPVRKDTLSFHDSIANIAHGLFARLELAAELPQPGHKVIACFIMEDRNTGQLEAVSFGSGTRCVAGDKMGLNGEIVNDSHAEIIAHRGLMRFFYQQLHLFYERGDRANAIFEPTEDNGTMVRVKDTIRFHLYISTAPCGDGAQFSRSDHQNQKPPTDFSHCPTFTTKKSLGVLRTKIEGGEGTVAVSTDTQQQTWDGILQGDRLRTMSCSDKVGSWNVLGLQGALLSLFMTPVYMTSLTLGSLYHHGHLSRAVCCRFGDLASRLPPLYKVNHPLLGRIKGGDNMKRHTEKTTKFSINWVINDTKPEMTIGATGLPVSSVYSQVAKVNLFGLFRSLSKVTGNTCFLDAITYRDAKSLAKEYQHVKRLLHQFCEEKGFGSWLRKPQEQEEFTCQE